jgi:hypothetical protein
LSSWNEVDLSTVPTEAAILPEGKYEFELLPGARFGKWDADRVEAGAKVASGEFSGRICYFNYPSPAKVGDWVYGVFVRMTKATGVEIEEGETPVDYLNRVAGEHFMATLKHRTYADSETGESVTKMDLKIGSVGPVRSA